MSLSTYMALCLSHPAHGYYRTRDPFGRGGDFITAPEVSQMFGEIIGAFVAGAWQALGRPQKVDLVELGPGRGTLMADAMRVAAGAERVSEIINVVLVEISEPMIAAQRERLSGFEPSWLDDIEAIDVGGPPLIVIANEFFDALPIKQFQKSAGAWHERLIGLEGDVLRFGLSPASMPATAIPEAVRNAEEGSIWEAGLAAQQAAQGIARRIAARGGVALVIDYGYAETQAGDTFQAVADHRPADPLASPGEADLTAHVDFAALAGAVAEAGAIPRELLTQAQFLAAMGIVPRAKTLSRTNPHLSESITADLQRLTGREQMGALFKVLCFTSPGVAPYPFGDT